VVSPGHATDGTERSYLPVAASFFETSAFKRTRNAHNIHIFTPGAGRSSAFRCGRQQPLVIKPLNRLTMKPKRNPAHSVTVNFADCNFSPSLLRRRFRSYFIYSLLPLTAAAFFQNAFVPPAYFLAQASPKSVVQNSLFGDFSRRARSLPSCTSRPAGVGDDFFAMGSPRESAPPVRNMIHHRSVRFFAVIISPVKQSSCATPLAASPREPLDPIPGRMPLHLRLGRVSPSSRDSNVCTRGQLASAPQRNPLIAQNRGLASFPAGEKRLPVKRIPCR